MLEHVRKIIGEISFQKDIYLSRTFDSLNTLEKQPTELCKNYISMKNE